MTDMTCDDFHAQSAELALGVLDGRERSDALAHIDHCLACRHHLMEMGDLADQLFELAPEAEPPAGFETRVLAAFRPAVSPAPTRRRFRQLPLALLLSAAVFASVIGVGGWALGQSGSHGGGPSVPARALTATFVSGRHHVGQLMVSDGPRPWVYMVVDTGRGTQTVTCQLRRRSGTIFTVGSFTLANGYGYWGAPVPFAPSSISSAQLVDTDDQAIATATVSAPGP